MKQNKQENYHAPNYSVHADHAGPDIGWNMVVVGAMVPTKLEYHL